MCRGYHRRSVEQWRHTREHITALFNVNRAPDTPVLHPIEVLPLPGDTAGPSTAPETPEDIEALWAALDERDALLFPSPSAATHG